MGAPNPNVPQVNDPELEAELIRQLSVIGNLGKLRVLDVVLPTISMGNVITPAIDVRQPAFRSTDIFSAGVQVAALQDFTHARTGDLPEGTYDVRIIIWVQDNVARHFIMSHLNAANTVVAQWFYGFAEARGSAGTYHSEFGYELALNEELLIQNAEAISAGDLSYASIWTRRRT